MRHDKPLTFSRYKKSFKYAGDAVFQQVFERNSDKIGISKEKFAVRNLKKIFAATFKLVPKIGFQAMSLRDLSSETGLSMGGIYSTITNKENIALIVKDVVTLICEDIVREAKEHENPAAALETMVRRFIYASTIMQPWFYFLYFETRSLSPAQQQESKELENYQVEQLEAIIKRLRNDEERPPRADLVANMALALLQERYLKPWKYKQAAQTADAYADDCIQLLYRTIGIDPDAGRQNPGS
jgi:AcrR family transcriptional regulator